MKNIRKSCLQIFCNERETNLVSVLYTGNGDRIFADVKCQDVGMSLGK